MRVDVLMGLSRRPQKEGRYDWKWPCSGETAGSFLGLAGFLSASPGSEETCLLGKTWHLGAIEKRVFLAAQGLAAGRSVN